MREFLRLVPSEYAQASELSEITVMANARSAPLRSLTALIVALVFQTSVASSTDQVNDANWYDGGTQRGSGYFSSNTLINDKNVSKLGFAWQYLLGTSRGQEATPVVIDGILYTSGSWGYVYAVNAATGKELWRYDPTAQYQAARHPCCDLVNRGVAVDHDRVYVVAVDGKLHALDAASGKRIWVADSFIDHTQPYSSTGAPLVAGKLIVIGNSGGDMGRGGVRGYVSAFSADTGELKWRFYTVPPAPGELFENPELAAAEKTWPANRSPIFKGGGTAWDGFAYDSERKLIYFGTGNPAPYDPRQLGSPGGDTLYTDSIIALHVDTGKMAWYYQTTPGDHWDYDATQKLVLTDLAIGGQKRQVLLQANKNGFFYVLDRLTGELLSAQPFTYVNWASSIDKKTHRPVLTKQSDWYAGPRAVYPSVAGGHTWHPMSYSPRTGLVYIPVLDTGNVLFDMTTNGGVLKFLDGEMTVGVAMLDETYDPQAVVHEFGPLPSMQSIREQNSANTTTKTTRELLRAWDPVKKVTVWEQETSAGILGYDGGVLSTAGNLVVQGRGSGDLVVYAADTGKVLKTIFTGSHIMAAPMSFLVDGVQYIAVQVGYGGSSVGQPFPPGSAAQKYQNTNRLIAFRLNGGSVPTPPSRTEMVFPEPPPLRASPQEVQTGSIKFAQECARCHIFGPGITPDLRALPPGIHAIFDQIVLRGALAPAGMERFDDLLSNEDVHAIHAYLISEAWNAYELQQQSSHSK